jgi:hypothetical protein
MERVDRCAMCGARLAEGADWCARCFAPRGARPAEEPERADGLHRRPPAEPFEVEYSARRPGPVSLGWIGRGVTSLLVVILLWWIYIYAFPFMGGSPTGGFFLVFLVFAVPVLVVVLRRIWRPTRIR